MSIYEQSSLDAQLQMQTMQLELMQAMTKASMAFAQGNMAEAAMCLRDASGVLKKMAANFDQVADDIQTELSKEKDGG
jgi:hypothetical protein